MLGRALFSLVCLIIVAGALLPMYPAYVEAPDSASTDPAYLVADLVASDCRDCTPAYAAPADAKVVRCQADCLCERSLPTSSETSEATLSLTVHLIVGRASEGLAEKLPAI